MCSIYWLNSCCHKCWRTNCVSFCSYDNLWMSLMTMNFLVTVTFCCVDVSGIYRFVGVLHAHHLWPIYCSVCSVLSGWWRLSPCLRLWGSAGCCVVNWCVSWARLHHSHYRRLSILMLTSLVKTSYSLLCTSSMYLLLFCILLLYIWDDVSGCWRWARPVRSDRPNQDTAASSTSTLNNIQQVHHRNMVCDQQSCCDELYSLYIWYYSIISVWPCYWVSTHLAILFVDVLVYFTFKCFF